MSRVWKPGDVAMVTHQATHPEPIVAVRAGVDSWYGGGCIIPDAVVVSARALVVIDPEDESAVRRLVKALYLDTDPSDLPATWQAQAALREFADPKPPACGSSIDLHYSDGKGCNYTCTLAAGHNGMHACADSVMWGGAA